MPAGVLIAPSGELDVSLLETVSLEADDKLSVVAALGVHGAGQSSMLDALFDTSFAEAQVRLGIGAAFVKGDDAAVIAEAPCNFVVLDVEGFDGPDREREELCERSINVAVALSDVILFSVRMNDLSRVESNGMAAMRASLTEALMLHSDGKVPAPVGKRAFVVLVRDYEAEVLPREELISGFLQEMQTIYTAVAKPPRTPSRVTEMFEFEFVTLPNAHLCKEGYDEALSNLRARFLDAASDDYLFEGGLYARDLEVSVAQSAEAAWGALEAEQTRDMPPAKDLASTFDCESAMRKVFEKYRRSVRIWRRETDGGGIIESFGASATTLVKETLSIYERDAVAHNGSKAFRRKKDELEDLLDADLYELFIRQIAKLRDVSYRLFKEKIEAIPENESRLERSVNAALKESQKYFRQNAESLRPSIMSWRYDNDSKELAAQMREAATEKLQLARLADYHESGGGRGGRRRRRGGRRAQAGGRSRHPIQVGIHYLDPAPFGFKDSRHEKLSVDDNLTFQPGALEGGSGVGGTKAGGLSVPIMPSRKSGWARRAQEFVYTEKK